MAAQDVDRRKDAAQQPIAACGMLHTALVDVYEDAARHGDKQPQLVATCTSQGLGSRAGSGEGSGVHSGNNAKGVAFTRIHTAQPRVTSSISEFYRAEAPHLPHLLFIKSEDSIYKCARTRNEICS